MSMMTTCDATYHGSVMSTVTIRCQNSYYREWSMDSPIIVVFAAHRRRQKLMGTTERRRLSEYSNDAWASRELVSSDDDDVKFQDRGVQTVWG